MFLNVQRSDIIILCSVKSYAGFAFITYNIGNVCVQKDIQAFDILFLACKDYQVGVYKKGFIFIYFLSFEVW